MKINNIISKQDLAEGGEKDRQWSNKDIERLRVATKDFDDIMASDGPDQTKQNLIKKRIQTKPMAGPKGELPEQGVAEGSDHSLKKVWDRYSKHLQAGRGDHSDIRQINKSGKILQDIRKYVKDHHGQKAVDDMERYAERRQWDEGVAEGTAGLPDPNDFDSDWDYQDALDSYGKTQDNDADYENMISEPDDWFDESKEKIGNMDANAFDDALARMKKLAGSGPLKTVYDPNKRVYRNVPVATQPGDKK